MPDWPTKQDPNQFPAIFGVSGTAGTSGLGTAESTPIGVNPATGAIYIEELGGGGTAGTYVNITTGTQQTLGTVGTVNGVGGTVETHLLPLAGVVLSTSVTVGTTATALPASVLANRKSWIAYNIGTISVFIGGSVVTTASGLLVGTGDYAPSVDLGTSIIYGISSATSGGTLNVMEVS